MAITTKRTPDAAPLNPLALGVWIAEVQTLVVQFGKSPFLVYTPGISSQGDVGKDEEGGTAKSYCKHEVGTEVEGGHSYPDKRILQCVQHSQVTCK